MNTLACVLKSNNPMHVLVFKHAVKQSKTVYLQFTVTVHARVAETLVARAHTALNWPSHPLWMAIKDKRNSFFLLTPVQNQQHTHAPLSWLHYTNAHYGHMPLQRCDVLGSLFG